MQMTLQFRAFAARALAVLVLCFAGTGGSLAQSKADYSRSIFDEFRLGILAHDIEPGFSEKGADINAELLFSRFGGYYDNRFFNILFRPRPHIGIAANMSGETSQLYAGLTWDIPLHERFVFEVSLGGSLHDGPNDAVGISYGCELNFRESVSLGYALSENWWLYGTVTHMSNANLCERNSGLTSGGLRLGYKFN